MKKSVLVLSLVLSAVLFASLVSAQWYGDLSGAANQLIQWIQDIFTPFFQVLLGEKAAYSDYFFAKILFLILLYFVILNVLKRIELFKKNNFVCIIISAIVSILATRYISEIEFFEFILIPQGALAISIAIFLPFLIYGFLVHESNIGGLGRRAAWIIFAAVFIGLWISRVGKNPSLSEFNWIYWIGIGAVAIVLLLDPKIHEYFGLTEAKKIQRQRIENAIAWREENLSRLRGSQSLSKPMERTIERLEKELEDLYRKL